MISSTDTVACNDIIETNRRKFWIIIYSVLSLGIVCEAIAIRQRRWKEASSSALFALITVNLFACFISLLFTYSPENCPHSCTCTGPDRSYLIQLYVYPLAFWQAHFFYRGYAWMKQKEEEAKKTTDASNDHDGSITKIAIADGNCT